MLSLDVVRVLLFFSFWYEDVLYPCALVRWFKFISDEPDEDTGMWMVEPEDNGGSPIITVIHLDCIIRAAHLIPIYGPNPVPDGVTSHNSLDAFGAYYINKFADHHAFEIAS